MLTHEAPVHPSQLVALANEAGLSEWDDTGRLDTERTAWHLVAHGTPRGYGDTVAADQEAHLVSEITLSTLHRGLYATYCSLQVSLSIANVQCAAMGSTPPQPLADLRDAYMEHLVARTVVDVTEARVAALKVGVDLAEEVREIRSGSDKKVSAVVGVLGGLVGIGADTFLAQGDNASSGETLKDGIVLGGVGAAIAFYSLRKYAQERIARLRARRHLRHGVAA